MKTTTEAVAQDYEALQLLESSEYTDLYIVPGTTTAVLKANKHFIPQSAFQTLFNNLKQPLKENNITKLVFDKRNLTVFSQPSMEWYYTNWKGEMAEGGLKQHRKLLPKDRLFRTSVEIGRQNIKAKHPNIAAHDLDVQYMESLDDAINA